LHHKELQHVYSTAVAVYPSYGIATAHRHSRMLFIYPLINLFSKKTTKADITQM